MKTQTDILLKNASKLHKLLTQERIVVDRYNDKYYITDGHFAIEVTTEMYDKGFRSKSGYYLEMKNEERFIIYPETPSQSGKAEFTKYIVNLFNPSVNDCSLAKKTGLSFRGSEIFISEESFVYSNGENIEIAEKVIPEPVWYYNKRALYFITKYKDIGIISMSIMPKCIKPDFEKVLSEGGYINGKTV